MAAASLLMIVRVQGQSDCRQVIIQQLKDVMSMHDTLRAI